MIRIATVVEGFGDVAAMPILLGRTGRMLGEIVIAQNPIRAGDWKSIKAKGVLPKFLQLAHSRGCDLIMLIFDLDDGCPVEESQIAMDLVNSWKNGRDINISITFLIREYEAIFVHCRNDIAAMDQNFNPGDIDGCRDAKGLVRSLIGRRYKETQDQENFTNQINLVNLYGRCRSYRKICKSITGQNYDEIHGRISENS